MVDEFKSLKENLIKSMIGAVVNTTGAEQKSASNTIRDVVTALASIAGKQKDEIVQILCREIGVAIAAVLKEPLNNILADSKLKVTVEMVPKSPSEKGPSAKRPKTTRKKKTKAKR